MRLQHGECVAGGCSCSKLTARVQCFVSAHFGNIVCRVMLASIGSRLDNYRVLGGLSDHAAFYSAARGPRPTRIHFFPVFGLYHRPCALLLHHYKGGSAVLNSCLCSRSFAKMLNPCKRSVERECESECERERDIEKE